MNKKRLGLIMIAALTTFTGRTVSAGSINGAEASVIAAAQSVFEYNGKSYVAAGWCINELYAKFSEDDINLSSAQASSLISMGYANLARGVAEGYLIPIGGDDETPATEAPETEEIKETEETVETQNTESEIETELELETETQTDEIQSEQIQTEMSDTDNHETESNKQETAVDHIEHPEIETEAYIRSEAIAGLGAVKKVPDEESRSYWYYFGRYMLRQIIGLLPDLAQRMLSQYLPL